MYVRFFMFREVLTLNSAKNNAILLSFPFPFFHFPSLSPVT